MSMVYDNLVIFWLTRSNAFYLFQSVTYVEKGLLTSYEAALHRRLKIIMEHIRILHIIDKLSVDGSKIHGPTRQIGRRFTCYDPHKYSLFICSLRGEDVGAQFLRKKGLEVKCLKREKYDPFTLTDIMKLIKFWKPSILHLSGYASWNFGRIAGRVAGVPVVIQEHFVDQNVPLYQRIADFCLQGVHQKGIAVSESVKQFMSKKRYVPAEDIKLIGNGISLQTVFSITSNDVLSLKKKLGIHDNIKIVGNVGRLALMKGQKYFIRAAQRVLKRKEQCIFVIVGEGPLKDDLKREAERLSISDKLLFVGYQENVPLYLSMFDMTVISSIGEGFTSVGLESFGANTPVIITEPSMVEGVYVDSENVISVPIRNSGKIAEAILQLIHESETAARLVRNGRNTVLRHDIRSVAQNYLRLYRDTVKTYYD